MKWQASSPSFRSSIPQGRAAPIHWKGLVIMSNPILDRYLPRSEFSSYEDFLQNYTVNVPENFNFGFDIVDGWAELEPQKRALVWCNDSFEVKTYTFADAKRLSNQAANAFRAAGIRRGDVVILILKQRPEVWWCITALCKLGAVCIPASFQLTPKDIVYRCNAADIKMIVAVDDDEIIDHITDSLPKCPTVHTVATVGEHTPDGCLDFQAAMAKESEIFEPDGLQKLDDMMLIYFSSGTTGMPKMVMHDFSFPLGHIVTAKYWQQVQNNKVHLTQSDSGWAKFAWGKIFGQWICGAAIGAYDTEKFVPHMMLQAMDTLRPTTFCAPATIYRYLIKEDLTGRDFSYVEHACVAGEPLNPEVYRQIQEKMGMELHEGFGQSEGPVLFANYGGWFPVKPGSAGKPTPLMGLKLLDEEGNECEEGIVGSICCTGTDIKHPVGLFKGYYKDEEATKKCWQKGVYNTGDLAWKDSDGYIWFMGRNDDVIKCSGYRIGPFEVESALLEHPSVLECAVTAAPDPVRGQVVKATIVLARGFEPSDALKKELQNHVKRVTAPYKYPRIVEFVTELPKTTSGKIRRTEIRKNDMERARQ